MNSVLHLLRLIRLDLLRGFVAYILEFCLVRGDAFLKVRNIVLCVFVAAVEHVPYADEGVSLALEVLEDTLFPAAGLVFEELLGLVEVAGSGVKSFVEEGHVIGVDGVGLLRGFGEARQSG